MTNHKPSETKQESRPPACSPEEAARLLSELKHDYQSLPEAGRAAVRRALKELSVEQQGEPRESFLSRIVTSLLAAKAYWSHFRPLLLRLASMVLSFMFDPISVLPAIIAGLWKSGPKESENHAAN